MTNKIISHSLFAKLVNTEGGASRTFRGKKPIKGPGVMVSQKGTEEKSAPPLTTKQAKEYFESNVKQADDSSAHGGWKQSGTVFQDTSRKMKSLDEARLEGHANDQIAGYDLGGTDEARPEGGNVFFNRHLKGVESDPEWKSTSKKTGKGERLSAKPKRGEREELANINRGATRKTRTGKMVPVTINEVLGTISKNRLARKKGDK